MSQTTLTWHSTKNYINKRWYIFYVVSKKLNNILGYIHARHYLLVMMLLLDMKTCRTLLCWHLILTLFLWVHSDPIKLGMAMWPSAANEAQGEGLSGGKGWARCFLRSLPSTLAVVWGWIEVMMPFNWGSWNASDTRGTAAPKSALNQVSLSEEYISAV